MPRHPPCALSCLTSLRALRRLYVADATSVLRAMHANYLVRTSFLRSSNLVVCIASSFLIVASSYSVMTFALKNFRFTFKNIFYSRMSWLKCILHFLSSFQYEIFKVHITPLSIWSCGHRCHLLCQRMETERFELLTPCLQGRCSPNWATPPGNLAATYFPIPSPV